MSGKPAKLEPVHPEPAPKVAETIPADDAAGLRNVMSSLASIFGGRDFMSDAELDAFLDSKMAAGEIPPSAALDPLDEAQSIIYEAWNSEGPQRVRLARRALETCADCADAYVILAEDDAKDRKQALDLFSKGVEAGERSLDPSMFEGAVGHFWGIMETRPYMRARLGMAECLWDLGRKEEAVGHLRELLRLNPSDNQGVRYILVQCLLETGADDELGDLLGRLRADVSPQIRYSHALWMFRHEGPGRKADALVAEAVKANPHVPDYLLKRRKPPKEAPPAAEAGGEEEAAAYAMGAAESWRNTLGALDWLAEHTRNS
jgi:tetratricopeptide (TPR) repeat protein